jgi:predicted acyltransferase
MAVDRVTLFAMRCALGIATVLSLWTLDAAALSVRVANGLSQPVGLMHSTDQSPLVTAAALSVSDYADVGAIPANATDSTHRVVIRVREFEIPVLELNQQVVGAQTSMVTVAIVNATGATQVTVLLDLSTAWVTDGIDRSRTRIVSLLPSVVETRTVSTECYKCLKPVQTPLLAPGGVSEAYPLPPGWPLPNEILPVQSGYGCFRTAFDLELDVHNPPVSGALSMAVAGLVVHSVSPGDATQPNGPPLCSWSGPIEEHSVNTLFLFPAEFNHTCSVQMVVDVQGEQTWVPLVVGLASALVFGILCRLTIGRVEACCQRVSVKDDDMSGGKAYSTPSGRSLDVSSTKASSRVEAIDVWRGICLSIMIFVNYGGGGYWWLDHSSWNGLTVADIVFACFVFTMGASMALSLRSQRKQGSSQCEMTQRMSWRAFKLLAVGLFLNNGVVLNDWRFPGVLQYFAIAAFFISLIDIWVPKVQVAPSTVTRPAIKEDSFREPLVTDWGSSSSSVNHGDMDVYARAREATSGVGIAMDISRVREEEADSLRHEETNGCSECCAFTWGDLSPYAIEWMIILALETVYLCVQFLMPVPGCPTGYIGPGGLAENGQYFNCTGGAHGYIDRTIWGPTHMYHTRLPNGDVVSAATCQEPYECIVYDPEGTLGAINAVAIAFLGLQAGRILLAHQASPSKGDDPDPEESGCWARLRRGPAAIASRWIIWGVACGLVAGAMCHFSLQDGPIPVTKNLWSPSYIIGMAGASFFSLGVLYILVDRLRWWDGTPFTYLGKNSIAVYSLSEILQMYFPFTIVVKAPEQFVNSQLFTSHTQAVVANIIGVTTLVFLAFWMFRNKIFVKL